MASSRRRRARRARLNIGPPRAFRSLTKPTYRVARRIVQPHRQMGKRTPTLRRITPITRTRKPRAALAIRRERMETSRVRTHRRVTKLLDTDCIPRPESDVAASKRWEYHYEDMALSRGSGPKSGNKLRTAFRSNRPETRFFRRFC